MNPACEKAFWAAVECEHAIWHFVRYKRIAELINARKGSRILDVGSGLGLMELMVLNKEVIRIDINRKDMVKSLVIRKKERVGSSFCGILADLHHLPFKEKFDGLVCSEVLEHLHNDRKALRAIISHLKEDGFLILTLPNRMRIEYKQLFRMSLVSKNRSNRGYGHLREYAVSDLGPLISSLPLKIEKISGIYFDFPLFHIFILPVRVSARIRPSKKIQFFSYLVFHRLYRLFWTWFDSLFWRRAYSILVLLKKTDHGNATHIGGFNITVPNASMS